jgi:ABC-type polar amino acid transport system ATPase subunit
MKIIKFKYSDPPGQINGWHFDPVQFHAVSLIVGRSGMGKSRLLNTIENFFVRVNNLRPILGGCKWEVTLELSSGQYEWIVDMQNGEVTMEKFSKVNGAVIYSNINGVVIFNGDVQKHINKKSSFLEIFDSDVINEVKIGIKKFVRRNFHGPDLSAQTTSYHVGLLSDKQYQDQVILHQGVPIIKRLMQLRNKSSVLFSKFKADVIEMLPNFTDVIFSVDNSLATEGSDLTFQTVAFKEQGVPQYIPLRELSSGMQKVILFLTDIHTLPEGTIYLIDELENSLGDNIIDKIPHLFYSNASKMQFIITTHHPYIINSIPIEDWIIFLRKGSRVQITQGDSLGDSFKLSKHDAFVKLQNIEAYGTLN